MLTLKKRTILLFSRKCGGANENKYVIGITLTIPNFVSVLFYKCGDGPLVSQITVKSPYSGSALLTHFQGRKLRQFLKYSFTKEFPGNFQPMHFFPFSLALLRLKTNLNFFQPRNNGIIRATCLRVQELSHPHFFFLLRESRKSLGEVLILH